MYSSTGKDNNGELSEELCEDNGEFIYIFFIDHSQNFRLSSQIDS